MVKVQSGITIFAGDTRSQIQNDAVKENRDGKSKTIYGGNLLQEIGLRDKIQQRRAQAQERALKIVGDAWNGDKMIDQQVQQSRDHLKELRSEYKDAQDNLRSIMERKQELAEYYGVEADSAEQQELELLEKGQAAGHPWAGIQLTKEEEERLAEIEGKELTEYQKRELELNGLAWTYQTIAYKTSLAIETENAVIRGIRLERLKKDPMLKAQQQAEDVMEGIQDEVVGMIVEEAKEHIDQEQDEREEEAETIKEKKEEQEEILEERSQREKELEELMEDMPVGEMADLENTRTEIQQEIQKIVNSMSLVEEDIRGAKVDTVL